MAEDSQDDYLLVELACRSAGINMPLVRVHDGVEAREYLAGVGRFADRNKFPMPALILADIKMPRMNGLELLGWIRTQPHLKRIPFVFLTSSSHASDINQAYEQFANSYLVKPAGFDQLTALLRTLRSYWVDLNRYPELPSGV